MTARAHLRDNVLYSHSWGNTLKVQKSALRWDLKRAMKDLCTKLSDLGEDCFVVTANTSNGWVGHIGSVRGEEFIDEHSQMLYEFLNYCRESNDMVPSHKNFTHRPDNENHDEVVQPTVETKESQKEIQICNVLTTLGETLEESETCQPVNKAPLDIAKSASSVNEKLEAIHSVEKTAHHDSNRSESSLKQSDGKGMAKDEPGADSKDQCYDSGNTSTSKSQLEVQNTAMTPKPIIPRPESCWCGHKFRSRFAVVMHQRKAHKGIAGLEDFMSQDSSMGAGSTT